MYYKYMIATLHATRTIKQKHNSTTSLYKAITGWR